MPDLGKFLINVYGMSIGMPLEGAVIRVLNSDGNTILAETVTDSSGKSDMLTLPCPPREYSLEYNERMPKPYAQYNLDIMRNGFEPRRVVGIEIMSGTTAIQNITLPPSNGSNRQPQTIVIDEHTLYSEYPPKILEEEVKPLPPPTGGVVLAKPVIPETIIVHDGSPNNASAPNYYVPFKDYIKNVSCSEIYSTWPRAAIKANILAIISFTLNRVFTEWYRGQGKNFTVTTSTAYDQAFSYGRTLFAEISAEVDEIFTTYITKPNIIQPLFSQYCDGRRVRRSGWLSQWGSKDLGDRGYDHIGILKNYYGYDIYLDQAEKVSGIPVSFPGYSIRVGSSGNDIRTIQNQLNVISNNYPAIPKLIVDGIFGSNTETAVKTFQKIFDLSPDGIVGFATWYRMSHVYTAVMKLAELV